MAATSAGNMFTLTPIITPKLLPSRNNNPLHYCRGSDIQFSILTIESNRLKTL